MQGLSFRLCWKVEQLKDGKVFPSFVSGRHSSHVSQLVLFSIMCHKLKSSYNSFGFGVSLI